MNAKHPLIRALSSKIKRHQIVIDDLIKRLAKGPAEALSWSQSAFEAAARLEAFIQIRVGPMRTGIDHVFEIVQRDALSKARFPLHSTSVPSNLISRYKTAALAEAVEMLAPYVTPREISKSEIKS